MVYELIEMGGKGTAFAWKAIQQAKVTFLFLQTTLLCN